MNALLGKTMSDLFPAMLAEGGLAGFQDMWRNWWLRGYAASDIGRESDDMFMFLWWFCVVWFVFLMGIVAYFVVRYRARKGVAGPRSSAHNTPLEIAWTIIPTIMLVLIFFKGFWAYVDKVVPPGNSLELSLTGFKWNWTMTYPNGAETNEDIVLGARPAPVFYVPEDTNVRFRMNSSDVMHAFWIPDYRIKADLLPNRYTQVWVRTGKAGAGGQKLQPTEARKAFLKDVPYTDHWIFCAEYCGTEHSEMAAILRVVPRDAYDKWVEVVARGETPEKWGLQLWKGRCMSCHSVDGKDNTGPTWKDLRNRDTLFADGSKLTAAEKADDLVFENYIRESIREPGKRVVAGKGNNMTPFPPATLRDEQVDAIIAYMKTLSSAPTPAK